MRIWIWSVIAFFIATFINISPVYANVIWPALVVMEKTRTMWAFLILLGLIVELPFIYKITKFSFRKALLADLVMNLVSTTLGLLLVPIAGILYEFFPGIIFSKLFNLHTFDLDRWIATFILAVAINTLIEKLAIEKIFKGLINKKGFLWLCLANAISVGVIYISLIMKPIKL